jgi:hypothetical protein
VPSTCPTSAILERRCYGGCCTGHAKIHKGLLNWVSRVTSFMAEARQMPCFT